MKYLTPEQAEMKLRYDNLFAAKQLGFKLDIVDLYRQRWKESIRDYCMAEYGHCDNGD